MSKAYEHVGRVGTLSVELALGHFSLLSEETREQLPLPMSTEKRVRVYGQDISYWEAGEGPPVILLHGLGGEAVNWTGNFGQFSEKYHVYAMDQIGFGSSGKPLMEYRIQTFVEFLEGFMNRLNIRKASLVGSSFGGWVAVDFAVECASMVDALILVSAGGLRPVAGTKNRLLGLSRGSIAGTRRILELVFFDKRLVTHELAQHAFEHHIQSGTGFVRQSILTGIWFGNQFEDEKLGRIKSPTLVVWGSEDRVVPPEMGTRFRRAIAGAELLVLEQCGHVPHIERPAEFNAAVLDFLDRTVQNGKSMRATP